jgi:hypothetical protein
MVAGAGVQVGFASELYQSSQDIRRLHRRLLHPLQFRHLTNKIANLVTVESGDFSDAVDVLNQAGFGTDESGESHVAGRSANQAVGLVLVASLRAEALSNLHRRGMKARLRISRWSRRHEV